MRRGILLSILLHIFVIAATDLSLSDFLPKKDEVKVLNVRLVKAKAPKKQTIKKEVKKVRSQQSAAPKAPPKKKEKPKAKPKKRETKVVSTRKVVKKPEPKKEEKKEEKKPIETAKKEQKAPISRPKKLDKSKKISEVKSDEKDAKVVDSPDDFLAALDFATDLEEEQKNAQAVGEPEDDVVITAEEEAEILIIKRHIERNWYRPPGIKGLDELQVHIEVKVNRDGTLQNLKVVQSSGRRFFDKSLERAVRKSVPLPIPGDKYDAFKTIDLHFNG